MKQSLLDKIIETILAVATFFGGGGTSVTPQSTTAPTAVTKAAYEAYSEIVQSIVDEYGYIEFEQDLKGIIEAKEFDITGDNEDELFAVYSDDEYIYMKVYEYIDGTAEEMWSRKAEHTGIFNLVVKDTDICVFWHYNISRYFTEEMVVYKDGKYNSVTTSDLSDKDYEYIQSTADGLVGESIRTSEAMLKKLGFDDYPKDAADIINVSTPDYSNIFSVDNQGLISHWELTEPTRSKSEILSSVAYYGDTSKCKMTKEMAQAYKDVLKDYKENAANDNSGVYAMLMDLADDGMPVLAVIPFTKNADGTPFYTEFLTLNLDMWGWDGASAQKQDFDGDIEGRGAGCYYFTTAKKDAMITVGACESGSDGETGPWELVEYTVKNGRIKLTNRIAEASEEQYDSLYDTSIYDVCYSYRRGFQLNGGWRESDSLIAALDEYINSFNKQSKPKKAVAETAADEKANIVIDYSRTDNGARILGKLLKDTKPNNAAITDIAEYIRICVRDASEKFITAKDNTVTLKNKTVRQSSRRTKKELDKFNKVLNDNSVTLNKSVDEILLITCKDIDINGTIQLVFDKETISAMDGADEIIVALDDKHRIRLSDDTLKTVTDTYSAVTVRIIKTGEDIYEILFIDNNGEIITQLDGNIGFVIPAENNMYTVQTEDNNIGCQFDPSNNTVMFETAYSGTYTVFENKANISDISQLDKAHRDAIQFMVSKGYFTLDDNSFKPANATIRYEFAQALTGMFFLHDPNRIETRFTDVADDSPYLTYVASGEYWDIIEGYDDVTFGGDDNLSYEQAIAMCSRLLKEKKKYNDVENPDEYLNFTDNDEISDWARELVALAVREGLIEDGGKLNPQSDISKADSALLLYRLFMLLHETEPVEANVHLSPNTQAIIVSVIGGIFVAVIGLSIALVVILIKKKRRK